MFEYETDEDRSFIRRHRDSLVIGVVVVLGGAALFAGRFLSRSNQTPVEREALTMIVLPPTPPPPVPTPQPTPPPPPPVPEQPEEHRVEEQQPVQDEKKPERPKEKAPEAPAPLGTSISGPGGGPDLGLGIGLGGSGGYGSGGGGGGSRYGWYASDVQERIGAAVRSDARVRRMTMHAVVKIWPDSTGRIARATVSSSGDSKFDSLVQNQTLTGLQLAEAPPADMPLPIVMHLTIEQTR